MPLEHSSSPAAFKRNVSTLMGEVGKSPHVQSQKQALAIAFATQRRGHADGGVADVPLPTPDPRTQDFVVNAIHDYSDKVGRPIEGLTGSDIMKLQKQIGVTSGRPARADGGVAGYAFGGSPYTNWQQRQEVRNMMRPGPILSSVAGRTDHISTSLPSSSHVLPADHISALGQGNTLHGFAVANSLFGASGPYGSGPTMRIGRSGGAPKPPPLPKFGLGGSADEGGAREGHEIGTPVPCNVAGGEFLVGPESVLKMGQKMAADLGMKNVPVKKLLDLGHAAIDRWILATRKRHISTLKGLPPPAKR
jgi:hypothetical protein